ncbi:hypothetical protein [Flavobacterium sp.]|uniref:hypothetical protein n=1 Tax=Flavobacterium sp. TaxID=239 RepID=UPI00286D8595|nr:hypothetical protein [Flavobacterium sp.]
MITTLRALFLVLIITTISCKKKQPQIPSFQKEIIKPNDIKTITPYEAKTYHIDKKYKYEYRTGISGDYEYNYKVIGTDKNGIPISGNINIDGNQGAGIITNKYGEEIEIEAEWMDYGKLKAIDNKGNEYELEVDVD